MVTDEIIERARAASFDERLSLLSMLMDRVISDIRNCLVNTDYLIALNPYLKQLKAKSLPAPELNDDDGDEDVLAAMLSITDKINKDLRALKKASAVSREDERIKRLSVRFLEEAYKEAIKSDEPFERVRDKYNSELALVKGRSEELKKELSYLFDFAGRAFKEGNEMLILTTEMTVNTYTSRFIARYGCDEYMKYKDEMMLEERTSVLKDEIKELVEFTQ